VKGFLGTKAGFYSDLSLVWEVFLIAAFVLGYYYARKHKGYNHHYLMLATVTINILFFITYMIKVLIEGSTNFTGPASIYKWIYLPTVIIHSIVSTVTLIFGSYLVYFGYQVATKIKSNWVLKKEKRRSHIVRGQIGLLLFGMSALSGLVVYFLLYVWF
jgi:putative membrane protein